MASATAVRLLGRGVHWADYHVNGRPVLLAVNSEGDCIRRVRMSEDVDEGIARAFLTGLLDHYDPLRPPLRLVHSSPAPARRGLFLPLLRR